MRLGSMHFAHRAVRASVVNAWRALVLAGTFGLAAATAAAATTVSVSPTTTAPSGTITVTWSGIAAPTATDWIGVYTPGAADSAYQEWRATTGAASGSVTQVLGSGKAPGTYEVRLFANNGYTRLATSNTFTVVNPTLTATPASVAPGGTLTATWSGIGAPKAQDWIAVYVVGAADSAYQEWSYTNGAASGSLLQSLASGKTPGTYELRLFSDNGFLRLATSNNFLVNIATVSASPASVARGGAATAAWSGVASPAAGDWVGVFTPGAADGAYITRQNTPGTASGSIAFTLGPTVPAGTYEMRLFSSNGNIRLAKSSTFTLVDPAVSVTPTSTARAGTVTVSWSAINAPATGDWIGLYTPGAADSADIARQNTTGTASGSIQFTLPTAVMEGTYEMRIFAQSGVTRLAVSNSFIVQTSAGLYFVYTDHLNTPRLITNNLAQTVWTWDNLDPFGGNAANENPGGLGTFTCNLRLPGQYFDKETNLHYNYFRDYDPGIGRYIQSDPIGLKGGINTYAYVAANPLSFSDPRGLDYAGTYGMNRGPKPPNPLPYDPTFGPNNCSHYPPGLLTDICSGTPNNPSMNCSRKCVGQTYPGSNGRPQDFAYWLIPQHPICWWECNLTPFDFCPAK